MPLVMISQISTPLYHFSRRLELSVLCTLHSLGAFTCQWFFVGGECKEKIVMSGRNSGILKSVGDAFKCRADFALHSAWILPFKFAWEFL